MLEEKELTIRPYEYNFDKERGYDNTKVLGLEIFQNGQQMIMRKQPTTWASTLRLSLETLQGLVNESVNKNEVQFHGDFNNALRGIIDKYKFISNTSFCEHLFTEPTHIKSSIYRNSGNGVCKIYDVPNMNVSMNITAVYSGEVVWVLNALVTALHDYDITIVIKYADRDVTDMDKLMELYRAGKTRNEIAKELQIAKGSVSRLLRKAREEMFNEHLEINHSSYADIEDKVDHIMFELIELKKMLAEVQ